MPTLIEDTIAALSTPWGKSGLAVIRLSGPEAFPILMRVFRGADRELKHRQAVLGEIFDPDSGHRLDQAVVTRYQAPHSYTREDVVEISSHGSPVILKAILEMLLECGARLATPGEFTQRAFLHGRIDLVQAEAIHDLIEAKTLYQARVAQQQAAGAISQRLHPLKQAWIDLMALLEAGIDFAEDDVPVLSHVEIRGRLGPLQVELQRLANSFSFGKIVASGITLAIVGRPNVGKSSLFNAFLQEERALVTDIPGTTRDLVSETAQLGGIPVRLVDTAGIREVSDKIERLGVDRSWTTLADADRLILMLDGSEEIQEEDVRLLRALEGRDFLLAINKVDLPQQLKPDSLSGIGTVSCRISARTGEGIELLKAAVVQSLHPDRGTEAEDSFLTNVRHEQLVKASLSALERANAVLDQQLPHEVLLLELSTGLKALNALTGETTVDDILNHIFSRFCIGK
jgi:tRNA modification GTPase